MVILSHRGHWKTDKEKNTPVAFKRSFSLGFGTELDLRDYCGKLVISHDIPNSASMNFETFLEMYCQFDKGLFLAINIKAAGLQNMLLGLLTKYRVKNYFVFDMSIPDALRYLDHGINAFTRESEFEVEPALYEKADGVWMDEFKTSWITLQRIQYHIDNGKKVCVVSPELHHADHLTRWEYYKAVSQNMEGSAVMLCTDFPEEARRYFND